jgi:hypothetical protein
MLSIRTIVLLPKQVNNFVDGRGSHNYVRIVLTERYALGTEPYYR